jgi:cation diffusion facilitator CzcD-associated flavoprotein CzcO
MKICVIGAGPSGLTTIKQLLDEGHAVQCFEKSSDIGGIWHRSPDPSADAEDMKVFDSLILTISMKLMSYSDFMVPGPRVFYTHRQYRQYLDDYAEKFGLRRHITLDATVDSVHEDEAGRWVVTVSSQATQTTAVFDAVAVCSGPFQTPDTTSVPDLDRFSGAIVHSSAYRNNRSFTGKRVLVVGLAESGADIAREVSDVASACTLSIRSRSFLIPRMHNAEYATDATATRVLVHDHFVRSVRQRYPLPALHGNSLLERAAFHALAWTYRLTVDVFDQIVARLTAAPATRPELNIMGEPADPPKLDIACEWTREHVDAINEWNKRSHDFRSNWSQRIIFSKNVSFIPNIVNGKLGVNDSGIERISGDQVVFKDGNTQAFDMIVLCTGFKKDFSALGRDLSVKDNNVRNLYKHAFHPDHGGRLAFIGFVRPYTGGIPIVAEMQARYFALLCSGKHQLPDDLEDRIAREKAWEDEMVALSPRHPETIPSQQMFLDGIAKEIGCLMPLSKLMFEPRLLVRHWFYPFNQACYRLTGAHSDPESARREMLSDADGPGGVFSRATFLLLLLFCPSFVHPKYVIFDPPRRRNRAAARR